MRIFWHLVFIHHQNTMTRSTSYFSLYAGSPTDTNIKLVVQLAILSQKNVQETYKTEWSARVHNGTFKWQKYFPSVLWHCWLGIRKSIQPVKMEWWGVGVDVVIRLEQGADCLHMVQPMPLHPRTLSSLASFKSRLVLPFWYWFTQVVLEKSVKWVCKWQKNTVSYSYVWSKQQASLIHHACDLYS